jgi:hypothetical protein
MVVFCFSADVQGRVKLLNTKAALVKEPIPLLP